MFGFLEFRVELKPVAASGVVKSLLSLQGVPSQKQQQQQQKHANIYSAAIKKFVAGRSGEVAVVGVVRHVASCERSDAIAVAAGICKRA